MSLGIERWLSLNSIEAVAAQVLGAPEVESVSYHADPIAYVNLGEESRALFMVSGTARIEAAERMWSFILKRFYPLPDGSTSDAHSPHYWRREVLAYTSGLLDRLPSGLETPRCYSVTEAEDSSLWLCMETVTESTSPPWPLSRYEMAAYHLGLFNGRYAIESDWRGYDWLSSEMTHVWSEENAYTVDLIARPGAWEHADLKGVFPTTLSRQLLRLWDRRADAYRALALLPQTLCHHDAGHRNLFDRNDVWGQPCTVLVDWELVGHGAVGEELGNLFGPALINFEVDVQDADYLAEALMRGYLRGLHDAGWYGQEEQVFAGFLLCTLFRWLFPAAGWPVAIATDESGRAERQTLDQWGRSLPEVYRQWAGVATYLCSRIDATLSSLPT